MVDVYLPVTSGVWLNAAPNRLLKEYGFDVAETSIPAWSWLNILQRLAKLVWHAQG